MDRARAKETGSNFNEEGREKISNDNEPKSDSKLSEISVLDGRSTNLYGSNFSDFPASSPKNQRETKKKGVEEEKLRKRKDTWMQSPVQFLDLDWTRPIQISNENLYTLVTSDETKANVNHPSTRSLSTISGSVSARASKRA